MENWETSLQTVKIPDSPFFFSTITPLDWAMPMVAIKDIGLACADAALSPSGSESQPSSKKVKAVELHGPRPYSPLDVKAAFEEILGKGKEVQVRPVEKEGLLGFFGRVFPHPTAAKWFADMMLAAIPGGIMVEDPEPTGIYIKGETELVDVLRGLW